MECAQRNVEEQQQNLGARAASSTGVCPEDVGCGNVEDHSNRLLDQSNRLLDQSNGALEWSNGLLDHSKGPLDHSNWPLDHSNSA